MGAVVILVAIFRRYVRFVRCRASHRLYAPAVKPGTRLLRAEILDCSLTRDPDPDLDPGDAYSRKGRGSFAVARQAAGCNLFDVAFMCLVNATTLRRASMTDASHATMPSSSRRL
jgi:hypothetical protein